MREPIYKSRPVAPYPARIGVHKINEFIAMSEGLSNCYLIATEEGNVQINSGMFFEAPVHRHNFDSFSAKPVRYLALTQGHVDHVGGVAYFRQHNPGLQVIAQAENPAHQAQDARLQGFRMQRSGFAFAKILGDAIDYAEQQGLDQPPPQDVPTPDILFDQRYELSLGGLRVELIGVPGCETNDSLIVWLPDHKICFTGNLFGCPFGHFPNLVTIRGDSYRHALVCAQAADIVRALGAEMICYGHHHPIEGADLIDEELRVLGEAIRYVHDETLKGMNAGRDVRTLMREIRLPPELELGELYGTVAWSVRAIWETYAGWFHHESTTELYAVPPSVAHSDLIELAGAQAIVARARAHLQSGDALRALHLLDILTAQEQVENEAIHAAIDAHRALRAETENFWLRAWLDNAIEQFEQRLAS